MDLCVVTLCHSESQTFRRNISHPTSGSESKGRKKPSDPGDVVTFLRNFGSVLTTPSYIPEDLARHSHRFDNLKSDNAVLCYS